MKNLKSLILGSALAASLTGCGFFDSKPKEVENTPEIFKNFKGAYMDQTHSDWPRPAFITDLNGDGEVDVISERDFALWVGSEYRSQWLAKEPVGGYLINKTTQLMTPEIRKVASEAMKLDRELSRLVQAEAYRLQNLERKDK